MADQPPHNATVFAPQIAQQPSFPNINNHLTTKLTSTNYILWVTQLTPILRGYNLLGHVDGTLTPPAITLPDYTPNPDYAIWLRNDQIVLSWIVNSLSDTVISQVVGVSTAHAAWQRLAAAYASGSRAQIRQLKAQLAHLSQKNDDVAVYLTKAKQIFD